MYINYICPKCCTENQEPKSSVVEIGYCKECGNACLYDKNGVIRGEQITTTYYNKQEASQLKLFNS